MFAIGGCEQVTLSQGEQLQNHYLQHGIDIENTTINDLKPFECTNEGCDNAYSVESRLKAHREGVPSKTRPSVEPGSNQFINVSCVGEISLFFVFSHIRFKGRFT